MPFNEYDFPAIAFSDTLSSDKSLNIVFATGETISSLMNSQDVTKGLVLVASGYGTSRGSLYTNLPVTAKLASNEDLTPTLLNALGCGADVNFYSTGQNLLEPKRDWLVSTSGEKIIVIYGDQRIEVLSNGSYDITQISSDMRSDEALNVDLLSRAIKHLTRFKL